MILSPGWFGIGVGVDEDPVTGSAHTTLTPYWAKRLGKRRLLACQVSARSGQLDCELGQGALEGPGSDPGLCGQIYGRNH